MKPSEFLTELEKIQLWLDEESTHLKYSYRNYLGFYAAALDTDRFKALKQGYWSSFFFARNIDEVNFGFRISPELTFKDWPVCQSQQSIYSYTYANNIANFIAFNQVRMLLSVKLFPHISKDWAILMHLAAPLLALFGTDDRLEYIKKYAFDANNAPASNEPKDNLAKYLDFWFHYDKTEGHAVLRKMIDQLHKDEKWLPDAIPKGELGIWETRIKNALMSRAKSNRVLYGNKRIEDFIIEGFLQPHGYDAEDLEFTHHPKTIMSKISVHAIAGYFDLVSDDIPKTFKKSHLYEAGLKIYENFNAYQGEEHYQAALILEGEGKPLEAWNALVSASYWAGINNRPEYVEKHWQKAIEICQNQNWADAHDALTTQWDWYQDYKSKNK